jgi:hypothetical protein
MVHSTASTVEERALKRSGGAQNGSSPSSGLFELNDSL